VDPCYATHTWEFLNSINSHIRLEPDTWICPQCKGDSFIREDLANLDGLKPIELVHAQWCRLFLGVTTLADISTSNGMEICEWAINGQTNPRTPVYRVPRQESPSTPVWTTWRKVLRRCYSTTTERKLDHPLGKWYTNRITQVWNSVIDPSTHKIYIWAHGQARIYERSGQSHKQYCHLRPHDSNSFPRGCVPVSSSFQSGSFIISGFSTFTHPTETIPEQLIEMRLMNCGVHTTLPMNVIAQAIWDGQAILGMDGSVTDDIATYSWVFSLTTTNVTADTIRC
jgi:hypothetical protein